MFRKSGAVYFAVILCFFVTMARAQEEETSDGRLSIVQGSSTVFLSQGKKRAFFCNGTEPDKKWLNVTGHVVGRRSPTARAHTELSGTQLVLIIDFADKSDNGTWTCSAGSLARTVEIYIIEEARFKQKSPVVEAMEGSEKVSLPCAAHGIPDPTLSWYRDSIEIVESTDRSKYRLYYTTRPDDSRSLRLEIRNVNRSDAGEYECRAIQQIQKEYLHYETNTTLLQVNHPPTLVHPLVRDSIKEEYAIINETKSLNCAAKAVPKPIYKWTRMSDAEFQYQITENIVTSDDGTDSVLTIELKSEKDLGDYKCEVTNDHGSTRTTFHVSQGNKPQPLEKVVFKSATNTSLKFEVICGNCTPPIADSANSADPKNLPVTHYRFEAINQTEGVDWEEHSDWIITVDLERVESETEYELSGLEPGTKYSVRAAAINLAGPSEFTDVGVQSTVSLATAPTYTATLVALMTALVLSLSSPLSGQE